jgi:lysophospholipase II
MLQRRMTGTVASTLCKAAFLGMSITSSIVRAAMSTPASSSAGALIFLHGLGDSPAGWSSLQTQLPSLQPRLSNIKYVFPHAPTIPISINGGMKMTGWFDLFEWPISIGDPDDKIGKLAAVETIEDTIKRLETDHGIDRSKVVIGGFSQGGAIALLSAYHNVNSANIKPLAGCAILSGWMTLVNEIEISENNKKTPCFWAHGQYDDKVLFNHQKFGVDKLTGQGISVEHYQYPMGHESDPDELRKFAAFLDKVLFGEKNSEL